MSNASQDVCGSALTGLFSSSEGPCTRAGNSAIAGRSPTSPPSSPDSFTSGGGCAYWYCGGSTVCVVWISLGEMLCWASGSSYTGPCLCGSFFLRETRNQPRQAMKEMRARLPMAMPIIGPLPMALVVVWVLGVVGEVRDDVG
jgi:hypothetical protein